MDWLVLRLHGLFIPLLFAAAAWTKKGRGTHAYGIAGKGTVRIVDNPAFPAHAFFEAGKEWPCILRHATLGFDDDATKDARGAALKWGTGPFDSPLDLIMNSGLQQPFWDAQSFRRFLFASLKGPDGLKKLAADYPKAGHGAAETARRAPVSFSKVMYGAMLAFRFHGRDGVERLCKYRLVSDERGDSGVVTGADYDAPWDQKRFPDNTQRKDYLAVEYRERVAKGPVTYFLQIQLHDKPADGDLVPYDCNVPWDEARHPWTDLAVVTIRELLDSHSAEALKYYVGHQPKECGLWPARSIRDPNSVGWLRNQVYPVSQAVRFFAYRLTGRFGPPPIPNVEGRP